jgi:hypothetical protein
VAAGEALRLPRDFLDEVERELAAARAGLAEDETRVEALVVLHALVLQTVARLGRPVTVFEVVRASPAARELVRELRRET